MKLHLAPTLLRLTSDEVYHFGRIPSGAKASPTNSLVSAVGGDNSLVGGMISAAVLVVLNLGAALLVRRNRKAERILEGVPKVLVHNGRLYEEALRRENIAHNELAAALREAGAMDVTEVHLAMLETSGRISVLLRMKG